MAKPNRQELIARIEQEMEGLQKERNSILTEQATLADRLRLVEGMLERYQNLLSPRKPVASTPTMTANAGSRTQARQERKRAMITYLQACGEAQTAEIIAAMKEALPDRNPTRAQVQDVLQHEPEFASSKKGVWGLAETERVRPDIVISGSTRSGTFIHKVGDGTVADPDIEELLG